MKTKYQLDQLTETHNKYIENKVSIYRKGARTSLSFGRKKYLRSTLKGLSYEIDFKIVDENW